MIAILVMLLIILVAGCTKVEKQKFDSYLDELDVDASLDSAEEIALGTYRIASALPKPATHSLGGEEEEEDETEPLWVQIHVELYAVIAPQDKKTVLAACERHRGMIDDTIVTICREASKEELDDSRWATLKSRIIDSIRPILGDDRIRQLSFADFGWEPL